MAGIYGPNASGKSNILDALSWLSVAVSRSLRAWDEHIPTDPFRFGSGPTSPSRYEIEMIVSGIRYSYLLEVDQREVLFESLHSFPERRRRVLFERDRQEVTFRRGLGSVAGTRELLTPTTLALSAAMRFQAEIRDFGRAISSIDVAGPTRRRSRRGLPVRLRGTVPLNSTGQIFFDTIDSNQLSLLGEIDDQRANERSSALALLRFADLGIDDVFVRDEADSGGEARRRLQLVHRVAGERLPFDLEDESDGTQTWFNLIGPTLRALKQGRVLLLDEIDASLHPRLSARLMDLFQDPSTNNHGAQLIFTSHDTSLLNSLNRDEVWLTEKLDGETALIALAEYGGDRVRRSLNLEKAYLQGRFGAVPELDQYILRRALGVVTGEES